MQFALSGAKPATHLERLFADALAIAAVTPGNGGAAAPAAPAAAAPADKSTPPARSMPTDSDSGSAAALAVAGGAGRGSPLAASGSGGGVGEAVLNEDDPDLFFALAKAVPKMVAKEKPDPGASSSVGTSEVWQQLRERHKAGTLAGISPHQGSTTSAPPAHSHSTARHPAPCMHLLSTRGGSYRLHDRDSASQHNALARGRL